MAQLAVNGGKPTCRAEWPHWPIWGAEEREAIIGVLESGGWWYGDKVREFEARFAQFQGTGFGVTRSSGTTALEVALLALAVGAGDEVIVPPYTLMATASAVLRANGIPLLADIRGDTLCLDPDDVECNVTSRTRAIIAVHLAGHIADTGRLGEIARIHGLFLVEDACHAWAAQWKGKGVGDLELWRLQVPGLQEHR